MDERAITAQNRIDVEVACALPDRQWVIRLSLPLGTTAGQAVEASGFSAQFPAIDLARGAMGIFGRVVAPTQVLRAGDRVEIYRPLLADPKRARRERAAQDKGTKQ